MMDKTIWTMVETKVMWTKTRMLAKEGSIIVKFFKHVKKHMHTSSAARGGKGSRLAKTSKGRIAQREFWRGVAREIRAG